MTGWARRVSLRVLLLLAIVLPLAPVPDANAQTVLNVGTYQQQYSLSCEFASLQIVTAYWGDPISEHWSLSVTPWSENPHKGFRGDIGGPWGSTWDYGIYAGPLGDIARWAGYGAEEVYDPSTETLSAYHDSGIPLIVWLSVYHNPGWYEWDANGDRYKIVPNLHVLVAYGHDDGGVYLSDPGTGWYDYVSWDWFLTAWAIMDGMALAVYPI